MPVSEPLPHFVDDLLGYLHETHPTHATLDGIHVHDDLLEDLSRHAIDAETRALSGYLRRLDEIDAVGPDRRPNGSNTACSARTSAVGCSSSKRCAPGSGIPSATPTSSPRAWLARRCSAHAPVADRARRVLSKLRQTPRVIQAARDNIKEPPGIFVKVGIETMRGALKFIDHDLPRAFAVARRSCTCSAISPTPRPKRRRPWRSYIDYLENEIAPKARASFRLGLRALRAEGQARRRT